MDYLKGTCKDEATTIYKRNLEVDKEPNLILDVNIENMKLHKVVPVKDVQEMNIRLGKKVAGIFSVIEIDWEASVIRYSNKI